MECPWILSISNPQKTHHFAWFPWCAASRPPGRLLQAAKGFSGGGRAVAARTPAQLARESSRSARPGAFKAPMFLFLRSNTHRIHGAAFSMVCHGSHRYTPVMLAYIPAPWILWDINLGFTIWLWLTVRHRKSTHAIKNGAYHLFRLGPFPMAMLVITRPGIRFIY